MAAKIEELLRAASGREVRAPIRVDRLEKDLLGLGGLNLWWHCSATLALTGELLLCCAHGGTLSESATLALPTEALLAAETLYLLRNAICHPAHVSDSSGSPHAGRLANHLRDKNKWDDRGALQSLRNSHVGLAERWMAELALGELDVVGREFIGTLMPKLHTHRGKALRGRG